jgi:Mg/Co/Ni transporter MgtE
MSLERRLAEQLVREHPERAAGVLERLGVEEAARVLSNAPAREAAPVLQRMSPQFSAAVLETFDTEKIARALEALPLDVASRLARRLPAELGAAALEKLGPRPARALRSLLRFPEATAGALMDPDVLALLEDLTAKEALDRIRETPDSARYNVYVVDHEQRLVGVVNLRELLLARPRSRLADLMVRDPLRLDARADRSVVVGHPGWKEVHSLPVVDEGGGYLGAVRYRTLRALEEELLGGKAEDGNAREALGQLFSAAAGGLLDALTNPGDPRTGGR